MSGKQSVEEMNKSLRTIVEHVPISRLDAAHLLWKQAESKEDYTVLVKHVPRYAEPAARRLLKMELDPIYLDCIFDRVTSKSVLEQTGRYILDFKEDRARERYAKVVENVPKHRQEALDRILRLGAKDHYDIVVVWKYAKDEDKELQWPIFVANARQATSPDYELYEVVTDCHELVDRAWPVYLDVTKPDDTCWGYLQLLDYLHLKDRAWQAMKAQGMEFKDIRYAILNCELVREEAWQELMKWTDKKQRHLFLWGMMSDQSNPEWVKERAAMLLMNDKPNRADLDYLCLYRMYRNEAARLLLVQIREDLKPVHRVSFTCYGHDCDGVVLKATLGKDVASEIYHGFIAQGSVGRVRWNPAMPLKCFRIADPKRGCHCPKCNRNLVEVFIATSPDGKEVRFGYESEGC